MAEAAVQFRKGLEQLMLLPATPKDGSRNSNLAAR